GFEKVGALNESVSAPHDFENGPDPGTPPAQPRAEIGGLTLRQALDELVAADRRYAWRVVDGVVVIRPVEAWVDPAHPLAQPAPSVSLPHAHLGQVIDAISIAFGREPSFPMAAFGYEGRPALRFPGGSRLALLNAAVRGRGGTYWVLASSDG